jgi:hypothetical protein
MDIAGIVSNNPTNQDFAKSCDLNSVSATEVMPMEIRRRTYLAVLGRLFCAIGASISGGLVIALYAQSKCEMQCCRTDPSQTLHSEVSAARNIRRQTLGEFPEYIPADSSGEADRGIGEH